MFFLGKTTIFKKSPFLFLSFFSIDCWVDFFYFFLERKNDKKTFKANRHILHIFHRFFDAFGSHFGPQMCEKGTKKGPFLRLAARRGLWRVPGTPRGRFLRSLGRPGGALGVSREPPGGLPGTTWLFLGSLWGLSEDILKVLGYFSLSQKVFR